MTPEQRRDAALTLINRISERIDACRDYLEHDTVYVLDELAMLENIGDNLRHGARRLLRER